MSCRSMNFPSGSCSRIFSAWLIVLIRRATISCQFLLPISRAISKSAISSCGLIYYSWSSLLFHGQYPLMIDKKNLPTPQITASIHYASISLPVNWYFLVKVKFIHVNASWLVKLATHWDLISHFAFTPGLPLKLPVCPFFLLPPSIRVDTSRYARLLL